MTSPVTYIPDYMSKDDADALFAACAKLPFVLRQNPRNPTNPHNVIRHQVVTFLAAHSDRAGYVGPTFPMSQAPKEILDAVDRLTAYVGNGRKVTYASVVRYRDENDHMNYHQHREDKGRNTPVLVISTGGVHPCAFRLKDRPETEQVIYPDHGSLYVMSNDANDTHEHAVLESDSETPVRYAINFKCIDDAYWTPDDKPAVFDCHAGKKYPPNAVYVGREVRDRRTGAIVRPDTIFGNQLKLTENAFRKYAAKKMLDPDFRAQVASLRGKHLLCWCNPDAEFCHAKVWLELANSDDLPPCTK